MPAMPIRAVAVGLNTAVIEQLEAWVQQELQPDPALLLDAPVGSVLWHVPEAGGCQTDRFESEQLRIL
jgi:thymidylate kinase